MVVCLPGGIPARSGKSGSSAVEGLGLAFLVDPVHQGFVQRIQIKPEHTA